MPRLTKRHVESLTTEARDYTVWDDELPGFGIRVWPSGKRVYVLKYRTREGRQRKPVIGLHGPVTAEEARRKARLWLGQAIDGGDPSGERQDGRRAPTLAEFGERYMAEYAEPKKKPLSVREDRRLLDRFILPTLGMRKVAEIKRPDVTRLHNDFRSTPYQANRVLALLSKVFSLAEEWGVRPDGTNPCRHVEKFREERRERFLSAEELTRLEAALTAAEQDGSEWQSVVAAIRLLIFTGARMSEILTLRWEWVDFDNACLRLPDSKTGAKVIHLSPPALTILGSLPNDETNPHVIRGKKPGEHLVNLQLPWGRIRSRAGIERLRIHDLRHSFASVAVMGGLSLPMIGALLGHRQVSTTARYAHLAADPLKQANDLVAANLLARMKGTGTHG